MLSDSILIVLIFAAALLYSSVGHAGASGFLAAMALMSVEPSLLKPTALFLNILVGSIATYKFYRAGCFSWCLFWPFACLSIPFAFVGGRLSLPSAAYKQILGSVLLFAAYRLFTTAAKKGAGEPCANKNLPIPLAMICGATIGILSGMTGVGGGIFLTPLLLFTGWAETKSSSGVSAAFILANSISGFFGHISRVSALPEHLGLWAVAACLGGLIGSHYGSRRLGNTTLRKILSAVLAIAGTKMIFAA